MTNVSKESLPVIAATACNNYTGFHTPDFDPLSFKAKNTSDANNSRDIACECVVVNALALD
ncbi:MAG: hypothetical protein ACRD5E_08005 [Nitrososphaeraceae archaeon]